MGSLLNLVTAIGAPTKHRLASVAPLRGSPRCAPGTGTGVQAKRHAVQAAGRGLDVLFRADERTAPAVQGAQETQHRLEEVEQALRQAVADLQTLDNYLAQIGQVLGNPERHLHGRKVELMLDNMNIKLEKPASGLGVHHTLYDVAAENGRRFDVGLIKCLRAELPPRKNFLERARPYLK